MSISEEQAQTVRKAGYGDILQRQQRTEEEEKTAQHLFDDRYHLTIDEYMKRAPRVFTEKWEGVKVKRSDWMPQDITVVDDDLRRFIDSHIPKFCELAFYDKFWLYIKQARDWLADTTTLESLETLDEKIAYVDQEVWRIDHNLFYGMDKYVWVKEAESPGGRRDYRASTPQVMAIWTLDAGYSAMIGKGRQAAYTSTLGPAALLRALVRTNMSTVLAADDLNVTGKNIFETKIKYPLGQLPFWLQPEDTPGYAATHLHFDFAPGAKKSERKKMSSDFVVLSANPTAINGQSPNCLLLDEATDMAPFNKIVLEAEPAMLYLDETLGSPTYGKLLRKRQVIAWSTGSSNSKGKGQYEGAYKALIQDWRAGKKTNGYLPLFFDWTCRKGMTREVYENLRDRYMSGAMEETRGLSPEEKLAMFGAHYPSEPEDMFMASHRTIVPITMIRRRQEECLSLPHDMKPVRGYFVPVYDKHLPMPDGAPFPFKVIGATWVPADEGDPRACVQMFLPPDNMWANRYWQGTDPIQADDGLSRMASVIWDSVGAQRGDEKFPTIACIVNGRTNPPMQIFLQTKLMGIHYRNYGQKACKELVEVNQGHKYIQFVQDPWIMLDGSLVMKTELPDNYRGGEQKQMYGIDTKDKRKTILLFDLISFIFAHGERIWHYDFWHQLRNTEVDRAEPDKPRWGTIDERKHNDDVIMAAIFAYICRESFSNKKPERISSESPRFKEKYRWVRDDNYRLSREKYKVPMRYAS